MAASRSAQHIRVRRIEVDPGALLNSFALHLRGEHRSAATLESYTGKVARFLQAEGRSHPTDVSRAEVEQWLADLGAEMAPATVMNNYLAVRIFFDWMVREGEVDESPFGPPHQRLIKPPPVPETRKDVVAPEDMALVIARLKAPRGREEPLWVAATRWRDAAIIATLYDTGMRTRELIELRAEDIDMRTGGMLLRDTKNKEMRMVHASPETLALIDRYWRRERRDPDYAFTGTQGRFSRRRLYYLVRTRFEEAGVTGTISPHDIRHTSASHVVGEMPDSAIMTLFGWKTGAMLERYTKQMKEAAAMRAHEVASPMKRLPRR